MKVPIRAGAFLAGGFLLGTLLGPVAAQQAAPADGQVAVRSDGAVYLISSGVRRWVATVVVTDDELNAIPEGEPIYVGLLPMGTAGTSGGTLPPAGAASPVSIAPSSAAVPTATPTQAAANFKVSVDPRSSVPRGGEQKITIKTEPKITGKCSVKVDYAGGETTTPSDVDLSGEGKCDSEFDVPDKASAVGMARVVVTVRDSAGRQVVTNSEFEVKDDDSSNSDNGNSNSDNTSDGDYGVTIDSVDDRKRGDTVNIKARSDLKNEGTCSGTITYDNDDETDLESKRPNSNGNCEWEKSIPDKSGVVGKAEVEVEFTKNSKTDRETRTFSVKRS